MALHGSPLLPAAPPPRTLAPRRPAAPRLGGLGTEENQRTGTLLSVLPALCVSGAAAVRGRPGLALGACGSRVDVGEARDPGQCGEPGVAEAAGGRGAVPTAAPSLSARRLWLCEPHRKPRAARAAEDDCASPTAPAVRAHV